MTALNEASRYLLLQGYIADVRGWKADDVNETLVFGVKNPAVDVDDITFYAIGKGALLSANPAAGLLNIGTTQYGKDGWPLVIVYNDGTVVILSTETPLPGQSGSEADLWVVRLNFKCGAEPAGSSVADLTARSWCQQIATAVRTGAGQTIALLPNV